MYREKIMGYYFLLLSHKSFEIRIGIKLRRLSGISLFSLIFVSKITRAARVCEFDTDFIFSSDVLIA